MKALALLLLALLALPAAALGEPVDEVDPMVGTAPPGFVFPGAVVPFGMVQNSPDTMGEFAYSGYLATDPTIRGFSLVHLSGPGVRKAGDLPFMPTVGPIVSRDPYAYASPFDHARERAEAGYYSVVLDASQTKVELTASEHAAMQRYTFPPAAQANVIVDVKRSVEGVHDGAFAQTAPNEITGWTRGRYPVHFVARFSAPIAAHDDFSLRFDATAQRTITMRAGISFVDAAGARRNLEAEAPDARSFDDMRAAARERWRAQLNRVQVEGGTALDRRAFYTALYHALLHPNVFTDVDGRYLGADGKPHLAQGRTQYANFSSWDTYKAQNQLLAILEPARYRDMLRSLLATYREIGKLPRWGEQNIDAAHMSGDPAIPMIADAACRGLLSDADRTALYAAAQDLVARRPPELAQLGYLPTRPGTTLEYGGADFALALLARRAGDAPGAAAALQRSLNYRNILDPETKWIRPRDADGTWYEPFSPTDETGFQEGNSWQYSWLAPHDARGLYDRMGGDAAALERLDHLFRVPPEVENRATFFGIAYRFDMHAPGNEHDMQVPWMYPFAGAPWGTQRELSEIRTLFRPTLDGLPGNDDLGSLSAFHVFSALGFGPVIPGAPLHVVGSPVFTRATVQPFRGPRFTVEAPGASLTAPYVRRATLNGRPLDRAWFQEAALTKKGGTLRLEMGAEPNRDWATAPQQRPPSASDTPLSGFGC
ncbi:MAG TPA: GH92 family glycosyl hydrolase [Solirubrobacteraceae bacterium]